MAATHKNTKEEKTWTDEKVEMLKKLWADGLSASQIATEIRGVTRNAIIGKLHRLGLAGRAKSPAASQPRKSQSPKPKTEQKARSRRSRDLPLLQEEVEDFVDRIEPAVLRRPVTPLHESPAFVTSGEFALTASERFAICNSLYPKD